MVGKIILYPGPDERKARKFYFESGKINFLKKYQGMLTADVISFKAVRNIWSHCDLQDAFP